MKLPGYYSSGEFARMANVSLRTIRFYDKRGLLAPSYVTPSGARFYTDSDFARLQQILLLKYLGFSLDDIQEMLVKDLDLHFLLNSLNMQKKLIQDRIEQMRLVEDAIENTAAAIRLEGRIDWSRMLDLIHLTGMEKSLKSQYQNAANISARIRLHKNYARNPQGWFPWIYEQCRIAEGMQILELGCGNGAFWEENRERLPGGLKVLLSDISDGMLRDARRAIGQQDFPPGTFSYAAFDCHHIPCPDQSFDLVLANHVLFYCQDLSLVFREIRRVLKKGGRFLCSTYSSRHMREITELVQDYDNRILLSGEKLYERFGLENGAKLLSPWFSEVRCQRYEDSIELSEAEPLIEYILSCHGNQNQILLEHYQDFRNFVERRVKDTFHITKDAGIFLCETQV